ncbi:MAG: hypothetical protein ACAI38_17735 [Myxococcota bacterium]|nr:hypothetical protein [Myxococcota bacterium]
MCSAVSDKQAIRALQTIQGFTSQRVVTVVGQEEQILTVNLTVHSRIVGALRRGHPMGAEGHAAIDDLKSYVAQGSSLHELVAANRKLFATADKLIRSTEADKVHTDLGEQLLRARPLKILTTRERSPAAAEIQPYAWKAQAALGGDTRAGKALVERIRNIDGTAETRDRYRHFGAFVMLCVASGVTAGIEIFDVARGQVRMPYLLGRRAVKTTLHFMEDVGFQALSTKSCPLGPADTNFYPTWSQAFATRE